MTSLRLSAATVARLVRQQIELGAGPAVFEGFSRTDVLTVAGSLAELGRDGVVSTVEATPKELPAEVPGRLETETDRPSSLPPASSPPASSFEEDLPVEHEALETVAQDCVRCPLSGDRTHVVFSDGNPNARVMVVGEAPGANEDRSGIPFVGPAGKLLDLLLASVDLSREASVYICNVIKCRPPGNRNPQPEEIEACAPYLRRQIRIVQPEVILAVGTFAARLLTESNLPLGKLRGEVHSYQQIPLVVTYHPAALLRNSGWTRPTWDDLQLLRQLLDSGAEVMRA